MGIVDDLKTELQAARSERLFYENDWQEYVTYTAPDMERAFNTASGVTARDGMSALRQSAARERSRKLYDPTAVWLLDRLASGVGSLTMPEGFHWHGVGYGDPFAPDPSQAEEEFFEKIRDHLFRVRYSGRSGFALGNRSRLLSTIKLGTAGTAETPCRVPGIRDCAWNDGFLPQAHRARGLRGRRPPD